MCRLAFMASSVGLCFVRSALVCQSAFRLQSKRWRPPLNGECLRVILSRHVKRRRPLLNRERLDVPPGLDGERRRPLLGRERLDMPLGLYGERRWPIPDTLLATEKHVAWLLPSLAFVVAKHRISRTKPKIGLWESSKCRESYCTQDTHSNRLHGVTCIHKSHTSQHIST